eukprot:328251-Pelagomonas_calceolata.AAC.10
MKETLQMRARMKETLLMCARMKETLLKETLQMGARMKETLQIYITGGHFRLVSPTLFNVDARNTSVLLHAISQKNTEPGCPALPCTQSPLSQAAIPLPHFAATNRVLATSCGFEDNPASLDTCIQHTCEQLTHQWEVTSWDVGGTSSHLHDLCFQQAWTEVAGLQHATRQCTSSV